MTMETRRFVRYRAWRRARAVDVCFSVSCFSLLIATVVLLLTALPGGPARAWQLTHVWKKDAGTVGAGGPLTDRGTIHGFKSSSSYIEDDDLGNRKDDGIRIKIQWKNGLSLAFELNCTPPSIDNFPDNVMSLDVLRHGGFMVNFAAVCYMFGVLALVCDSYFMPSLEILCADLNLSEDVAGASFMAIGGSAPELFTSIFGVFIAEGNIGVGTVIGSAVFNILCVIGLCGILAGQVIYLSKWPLARDFLCYTVAVIGLVLVILDNKVDWYESMIFILMYIAYLVFLYFNPPIKNRVENFLVCCVDHERESDDGSNSKFSSVAENTPIVVDQNWKTSSFGADDNEATQGQTAPDEKSTEVELNTLSPFIVPAGCCKRLLWFISFPASLLFYLTIPNCSLERWKRWYPLTFLMALAWIGAVTYLLVWMVTVLGYVFSLPDTVMGLTLVAAGSSTPDTILSVIAARNGYGDMAISHSVGSNIFDILLGLGLPWFLHSIAVNHGNPVPTYSDGLTIIAGMLLATVVVTLIIIKLSAFKLNKNIGAILLVFYVMFLVPAILLELNVIIKGLVLPACPREG